MIFHKNIFLSLLLLGLLSCNQDDNRSQELWYTSPAVKWMESLPIGNGRLGAMVYGGIQEEIVALNESSMWSGTFDPDQEIPFGKENLANLRELFFQGKLVEGNHIASEFLRGTPSSFGSHLPVGDLKINFHPKGIGEVSNYKRVLDLENAVARVSYEVNNIRYSREYIASNPDDILAMNIKSNKSGSVNFDLSLDLLRDAIIIDENNQFIFEGQALFPKQGSGGVLFQGRVYVTKSNGSISSTQNKISVRDADEVTIFVDIRTNYKNNEYKNTCKTTIERVADKNFKNIKTVHTLDYQALYNRVDLKLGDELVENIPTDELLKEFQNGKINSNLVTLFYKYARYLTIATSRHNSPLPIALQGFFNDNLACNMGWTNDYHLDINTQQNYWLTNQGNLAECNAPLFSYIADLAEHGAKTAEVVYGSKGWTAHTTANIWGYTAPSASIAWGLFPTAGSWLASHLWTHYEYTLDDDFLRFTAYPLLKANAEFLLDYMVEDPNSRYLMTGPSISPENSFVYCNTSLAASMMPTCDRILAYEIFNACIRSAEILNNDTEFAEKLKNAIAKLPPFKIGANGALQEWFEDYEEALPNHRHTTHLLAFYPFSQITIDHTPELANSVRKTIEHRLTAENWEDTEWSRANMINLYARLKDQKNAFNSVTGLFNDFVRGNLLTVSPAGIAGAEEDIFIIDGNMAGAAGIGEMLIQNHNGYIEFLPCLPEEWSTGYFDGFCVKGGGVVSADWKDSTLQKATLKSTVNNTFLIKIPSGHKYRFIIDGKKIDPQIEGVVGSFDLQSGQMLEIKIV